MAASHELVAPLLLATTLFLQLCLCQITPKVLPEFLAPLENHTVIQGREVTFTCIVNHLGEYRVAWIKSDSRAILAIHTHLVAHNPRLSVTHNGHNTWKLHVSNVQKNDSGTYMCQVNTEPMSNQMGYMEVYVPPDIVDDKSTGQQVTNEGGSIKLRCITTGLPQPTVSWRRERGQIVFRGRPQTLRMDKFDGENLELHNVTREDMGTYLCIASNGIPPTVSKRYSVIVNFAPTINVVNNFVSAPVRTHVVLECLVEASPAAMNTWLVDKDQKLLPNDKYFMSENQTNDYSWQMKLTIRNLTKKDFGDYTCQSVNALGIFEGKVTLLERELDLPPSTTLAPYRPNDLRPGAGRKKQTKNNRNRGKYEQQQHQHVQQRHHKDGSDGLQESPSSNGDSAEQQGTTRRSSHRTDQPHYQQPSTRRPMMGYDDDDDDGDDNGLVAAARAQSPQTILTLVLLLLLHLLNTPNVFQQFQNS